MGKASIPQIEQERTRASMRDTIACFAVVVNRNLNYS